MLYYSGLPVSTFFFPFIDLNVWAQFPLGDALGNPKFRHVNFLPSLVVHAWPCKTRMSASSQRCKTEVLYVLYICYFFFFKFIVGF
jgi:hypothetical protein